MLNFVCCVCVYIYVQGGARIDYSSIIMSTAINKFLASIDKPVVSKKRKPTCTAKEAAVKFQKIMDLIEDLEKDVKAGKMTHESRKDTFVNLSSQLETIVSEHSAVALMRSRTC